MQRCFELVKRHRGGILCALMALVIFAGVNGPAVLTASGTARQLPIYCVQREQKLVSISFDAAWGDVKVRQYRKPLCRKGFGLFRIHFTTSRAALR